MKKIILIILMSFLIVGCRSVKPSIISERKDSIVYVNKYLKDSINVYMKDSVFIKQKGDTIFKDSYHTLVKYKEKINTDTIKSKEYYNINKTVYINKLTKLQKGLIWVGVLSLTGLVIGLVILIKKKKTINK